MKYCLKIKHLGQFSLSPFQITQEDEPLWENLPPYASLTNAIQVRF